MAKAYILMSCESGSEIEAISSLKKIEGVAEAHGTLGLYDIIAKIELESEEKIRDVITGIIRKMPKLMVTKQIDLKKATD